jgi:hypothetical protein
MLHALAHRRPLVNGDVQRGLRVTELASLSESGALATLVDAGVDLILLHEHRLSRRRTALERLAAHEELARERVGRSLAVRIPRLPSVRVLPCMDLIPREAWRVTTGQEAVADGSLATHWRVSFPTAADAIEVEFEGVWSITGVELELGPHLRSYPRDWVVRGSLKEGKWRRFGHAYDAPPPIRSYRADHRRVTMPLEIRMGAVRWLSVSPEWSPGVVDIHEITLYGTQIGGPPVRAADAPR